MCRLSESESEPALYAYPYTLFSQTRKWRPSHSGITVSPGVEEMPSLNMPVQKLKVAILPLVFPCHGPVIHSGEISTTGKSHGKKPMLLDTWDRKGSTSGPTPWQIYEDESMCGCGPWCGDSGRRKPRFSEKNLPQFRFIYKKFPYRLSWNQIRASVMRRQ